MLGDKVHNSSLQSAPAEQSERTTGESNDNGASKLQTASKRFVFNSWRDQDDHELCTWAMVDAPERAPNQGRTGVATASWLVVDKRDGRQLVCNKLHDGPCEWPWAVEAS